MKVNIIGKGVIPGINQLAPAYNQELEKHQVHRLLNYSNLKVYGSDGIGLITKKNIDAVFGNKVNTKKPLAAANKAVFKPTPAPEVELAMRATVSVADDLAEAKDPIKPEIGSPTEIDHLKPISFDLAKSAEVDGVTGEILPEITEEVVTEEAVYEPAVEEPAEEVAGDTVSDDVTEETSKTEEFKPHYNNRNKKKNKNRHNNNN